MIIIKKRFSISEAIEKHKSLIFSGFKSTVVVITFNPEMFSSFVMISFFSDKTFSLLNLSSSFFSKEFSSDSDFTLSYKLFGFFNISFILSYSLIFEL